ncbi:hypothetical protein Y032_0442g1526 [Ancylostoma ceylanicum]|uniref:Uncharacterized protein n=1 Tax=Ancylostoma ceylanicum TaxID=53326 RepID=A0A016WYV2_9BILA|nr:hypothetical protein Y032_0442g1526 [Ancylostoma ceylanicum]
MLCTMVFKTVSPTRRSSYNDSFPDRADLSYLIQTVEVMDFHQGVDCTRILVNMRGDAAIAEVCKVTSPYLHLFRLRRLRSLPHWRPN